MSTNDRPTKASYWLLLTLAALVVRVVVTFWLLGDCRQSSDSVFYVGQARDIVTGHWTHPNFWPVGRSLGLVPFFWAFGTSETVIKWNAIAIDIGCVLLAAILAHQTLRGNVAARWAGWIAAFYPPMVLLCGWSYADNVTMFFLLAFAILAIAAGRHGRDCPNFRISENGTVPFSAPALWFACGCALAMAILTRPAVQSVLALGAAGCFGLLIVRRFRPTFLASLGEASWKSVGAAALAFAPGVLCCTAPVLWHNASGGAGWVLSTNNEMNCLLGNNPFTPNYKTWQLGEGRGFDVAAFHAYMARFQNDHTPRSAMVHEAIRYILERPDIFLLRTANRIRAFWGFDYSVIGEIRKQWTANGKTELTRGGKLGVAALFAVNAGGYGLVMLAAIAGLFLFRKTGAMDGRAAAFLLAVVAAVQFPYALTHSNACYHTSLLGFLFPFAAVAIDAARLGTSGPWPTLLRNKWFWAAIVAFILIQVEYAYWVAVYH
jgi:hypothetical protein